MPLILLIIGIVLIVYNYRAVKREEVNQDNNSLDITFQSVLQDNKDGLNDYKMEIGLLRKEIAESLIELQEEIFDIKNNINRLKNTERMYENKEGLENNEGLGNNDYLDTNEPEININNKLENAKEEFISVDNNDYEIDKGKFIKQEIQEIHDGIISEINFSEKIDSNKTKNIKELLNEGLTDEEICHKLSVSKGEVLLVKGLFKK